MLLRERVSSYIIHNVAMENLVLVQNFDGITLPCFHIDGVLHFGETTLSECASYLILSDPALKLHLSQQFRIPPQFLPAFANILRPSNLSPFET